MLYKHLFLLFLLIWGFSCSQLPPRRTDKLSILQGVTSAKEVEFSIVALKSRVLRFELRSAEGEILNPDEVKNVSRNTSPYVVHKFIFTRDQTKDFNLYVFEGEKVIDQRLIGRGSLNPDALKIAVASCSNDFHSASFGIWNELAKRNPQYLLLIGDNVYADKGPGGKKIDVDPDTLWNRYVDVRLTLPLYFQEKLIPTHAGWDDHDYGMESGNESFKYKKESLEIFEAFWAQDLAEEAWVPGLGAGGLLSIGDFNLYFLDGRSFRSQSHEKKHLGSEQEAWLLAKLKEQPGPSFIIKGDQFFGAYHGRDSFEGNHPQDFSAFTSELAKIDTPFIFLSGDRHMSEIMQFPRGLFKKPSFEITSSPIHSGVSNLPETANPWRVVSENQQPNFVMIKSQARDNHWFLDVESICVDGKSCFQRELAVYIKDLQNNLQEVRKKRRTGKRRYRKVRRQLRKRK